MESRINQWHLFFSVLVLAQLALYALAAQESHHNLYHVECGESPLKRYKDLAIAIGIKFAFSKLVHP
jgi:hypothetical protein